MKITKYPTYDAFELDENFSFEDSRRLPGANRFADGPAAILETLGPRARDAATIDRWRANVESLRAALGWTGAAPRVHVHAGGAQLVIPCTWHQLFTATEVNEYAWEQALGELGSFDRLHPFDSADAAAARFRESAAAEFDAPLAALLVAAHRHRLPVCLDDDEVSFGAGAGSVTCPMSRLLAVDAVEWAALRALPVALVTGSNGKTTTTRLIAAMLSAAASQNVVGLTSTEGAKVGGEWVARGDYSGPAGARLVLRDKRVTHAVLETARGGILRRGLAVDHADVAVVTNISEDHFGEYGVDSLEDLADVKLTVARVLGREGTLVLNADDPVLAARRESIKTGLAWFALDDDHPILASARAAGGATCAVRDGELVATLRGQRHALGLVAAMPLTVDGAASYNIANIAAATLAALHLGVDTNTIAPVLARFGAHNADNAGRLERWQFGGINVLLDYAHNPDGLARLLTVARSLLKEDGELRLLLGQAGNRTDADIAELARTAARFAPRAIVLKELPAMLRGRELGEVPRLLRQALLETGMTADCLADTPDEVDAAMRLVAGARPGDVVVLPVHQNAAKEAVRAKLDAMAA